MKKFKVWTAKPRFFDTLEEAREYANNVFKSNGIFVAVTEGK